MMRKLLLSLVMSVTFTCMMAHYSIHSILGDVKVENISGSSCKAAKGMKLKVSDRLIIPAGGKVEVYNEVDKKIYSSVASGKISLVQLMHDAVKQSANHNRNVANRLRFGKKGSDSDRRLYIEKGMVRRSLGVYDPDGEKIVANPEVIAHSIASRMAADGSFRSDSLPSAVEHSVPENGGLRFKVCNTLDFPLYFNIIKIKYDEGVPKVRISELGLPIGLYVLLPGQTIAREHFVPVSDNEKHVMVLTHSQFDIDEILAEFDKIFKENGNTAVAAEENIPLYILEM